MEKYYFTKCLNPQHIRNPHTGDTLVVGCGKCEACQLMKSCMSTLKCKLETLSSLHTRFITLTYSNDFIPTMIEYNADELPFHPDIITKNHYYFVDSKNPDEIITDGYMSFSELRKLQDKCNLGREIPYLRKRDLQLFLKRLRKLLTRYSDEKIRYYAVGEMGPVHYRPHFHLLLWFKEDKAVHHIRKCVRAAWKFGRVDIQKPIGDASSYVAGYLNGSCHLPRLFTCGKCKPFNTHSFFLGEEFLQKSKKEVYEMSAKDFVTRRVPVDGNSKEIHVWRSLKACFYPKPYGYATSNNDSLFRAYRIYKEASESLQKIFPRIILNPMIMARAITLLAFKNSDIEVVKYYINIYKVNIYVQTSQNVESFLRKVYNSLRLSKHFLRFCCDNDSIYESRKKIEMIQQFYKDLDYYNLVNQYELQESFIDDYGTLDELCLFYDYIYSYDEGILKLKNSKSFRCYQEKIKRDYFNNTKKKRLNDLNKLLFNF